MASICEFLRSNLPPGFEFESPKGGYFIWITGPKDFDGCKFSEYCIANEMIRILAGNRASAFRKEQDLKTHDISQISSFRLSIAFYEKPQLIDGASKLCDALKAFQKK